MNKTKILNYLLNSTEVSPQIVNISIPCEASKGVAGYIIDYVHHSEGIIYVWAQYTPMLL
jgi:hypothetical protein